ncbi:MAG: NADH-quinone oxidoreductase subunit L [Verrucomicrobiota bacterium]
MEAQNLPWIILLLPLLSAATILLLTRRSGNISALISTGASLITLLLGVALLRLPDGVHVQAFPWLNLSSNFVVEIGFQIDQLSRGMMFVVTAIGAAVHVFSLAYMKDDEGKARYFAGLSFFMFSMTGIVFANNFVMMFVFWELVGFSSYVLIGHWFEKDSAADAAKKAFLTNRIGDFGFMIGILLVWGLTKSIYFTQIATAVVDDQILNGVSNGLLMAMVLCVFCGAIGKSAQLPLHVWLPDAMEGPTPVSALIHAATMVAAGVYMLARIAFLIPMSAGAGEVIAWIGAITSLIAALMALQQNDIKRILAYSTLSQLGYMVMAVGINAADAAMFHLFTHAFFKALLFLGSGAVIYACHHEQDIWKMGGLAKKMPITFVTFVIGTAALMGLPFVTSGFFSKEAILGAALHGHRALFVIAAFIVLLTAFYMTRLIVVAFLGEDRSENAKKAKEVPLLMWLPLVLLAVPSVIAGYEFFYKGMKLSPAFYEHEGPASVGLIIASAGLLVLGIGMAFWGYKGEESDPLNGYRVTRWFANKFYVDEAYAWLIKIFQDGLAGVANFVDKVVVDGLVARLPAAGALRLGDAMRRLQSGNLQSYGFLFALGAVLVIYLVVFK